MIELEVAGQRTAVPAGELILGSDPSCGLRLSGIAAAHAVVMATEEGAGVVRRVGDNDVLVNGHKLGAEPAPILHGDKLQLGIHEILIHDPRRSGSTQFVSAADVAKMVAATAKPGALKPATAATGGRLVCLTDGREYTIGSAPLVFGREAGCDIVVPNKDVSRRHAEIFVSPQGYVLVDSSTNGTFVNGERIDGQRVLARADVLRVGDHEFRFYADKAPEAPPAAAAAPLASAPAEVPAPPAPAAGAAERLNETMHGMRATPPAPPMPPPPPAPAPAAAAKPAARTSSGAGTLATFLVRSGSLKGQRLQVRVPVVNIGRAEYNDIVVPDDSISGSHAKLQRREGIWILVDNDSTNGTWVDGERITAEAMLGPGAVVRFGEISVLFEPTDDHLGTASGSGTKVMGAIRQPAAPAAPPEPPAPVPVAAAPVPAPTPPPPAAPIPTSIPAAAPRAPSAGREAGGVSRSGARPPVIVSSPPPGGRPKWVVPLILVVVLGAVAAYLLTR